MELSIFLLNPPTINSEKFIREGRCTQQIDVWGTLWPPVSLATIGALLLNDGFKVNIFDCPARQFGIDDLKNLIISHKPGIIIWSTGTPSIESDLELGNVIKKINPSIKTAVFGTHVTTLAQESLENYPALDFIIRNEPEYTIRELVNSIQKKKSLEEIEGLSYRNSDNKILHNQARPFINNLDELPEPAWQLVNPNNYRLPISNKKYLIIAPIRGCPYKCVFCTTQTYYSNKLRKRSVNKVIGEIKHNIEKYDISDFFFWADTFTFNKKYVTDICNELINQQLAVRWTCNSRIDTVDKALLELMAQAGCWMISFGIESGSQEILNKAQKGIKVEQAYSAVNAAREVGIKTVGHFMLGLPGETRNTIKQTIRLSKKLDLDLAQFYCTAPFPGSKLYEIASSNKWIANSQWHLYSQNSAIMNLPTITAEEVNKYRKKAWRSYYFRPRTIWRLMLLTLKNPSLKGLLITLKNVLKGN